MGPESLLDLPGSGRSGADPLLMARGPSLWASLSVGDLRARAAELAVALRGYGLETGEHLAILADPGPEMTVALLAAARAGAIGTLIDPALTGESLAAAMRGRSVVQAVAGDESRLRQLLAVRADLPDLDLVLVARPEPSERPSPALRLDAACSAGAQTLASEPSSAGPVGVVDPVIEIVGPGAGGRTWSHAALLLAAERLGAALALGPGDVVLSRLAAVDRDFAPLLTTCLLRGSRLVFDAPGRFSLASMLEAAATVAAVVPDDLDAVRGEIVARGEARSWAARKLNSWAVARGRDPQRHPRAHRVAEVLVLRDLRAAAGPRLRLIQVFGGPPSAESASLIRAVGFTLGDPPFEGA